MKKKLLVVCLFVACASIQSADTRALSIEEIRSIYALPAVQVLTQYVEDLENKLVSEPKNRGCFLTPLEQELRDASVRRHAVIQEAIQRLRADKK